MTRLDLNALDFAKGDGVVTVVTIDATSGMVLMVAQADRAALERTLETGEMHYRSRTRGPWHKGATSGNVQKVVALAADCDGDTILARVMPAGPACHTGASSCFGAVAGEMDALTAVDRIIGDRAAALRARAEGGDADAPESYTQRLLLDRNLRLKKLGEEATELALACADEDPVRAAEETADVLYHALVALRALGGSLDDVRRALARRAAAK